MRQIWRALASVRTTVVILVVLAIFLLLNVALPQADGPTAATSAQLAARSPIARFLLRTLGLGALSTSAPFAAALALFFANLACVLVDRAGATLRRIRFAPPSLGAVQQLAAREDATSIVRPAGFDGHWASTVLRNLGYRVASAGPNAVWAVKNRTALLGFPLFHLSFFLFCAAGAQLYLLRSVAVVTAAEQQTLDTAAAHVIRRAPWGGPPGLRLTVERVDVRLEDGKPVDLAVVLRPDELGVAPETARVNHPAQWGDLSVLAERAGIAPVLWLQDGAGFTVDRVTVMTSDPSGEPAKVPLASGLLEASIDPIRVGKDFPERGALGSTPISLRIASRGRTLFAGRLAPGQSIALGPHRLQLEENRYWVGLRLVSERGGALLVAGFLLGVVGLVWRMLWFRREVVVVWDDAQVRIGGRAELFPSRFAEELQRIAGFVAHPEAASPARDQGAGPS